MSPPIPVDLGLAGKRGSAFLAGVDTTFFVDFLAAYFGEVSWMVLSLI